MANDREVLREIWEGKLPICFTLNPDEVSEIQQPDPFYLMVPRLSYFPLVTDKVDDISSHNYIIFNCCYLNFIILLFSSSIYFNFFHFSIGKKILFKIYK